MSKGKKASAQNTPAKKWKRLLLPLCVAAALLIALVCLPLLFQTRTPSNVEVYQKKLALLEAAVLTEETRETVGKSPAGGQANQAVFLSLCNTAERASVFCGTGPDLRSAWDAAAGKAAEFVKSGNYDPVWVKADVVYASRMLDEEELSAELQKARSEFFRYGVAFDAMYETALLEAELNGGAIYDYENGSLDLKQLNSYLSKAGRDRLDELPNAFSLFQCLGWFCDETDAVYPLYSSGLEYGRRIVEQVDGGYCRQLTANAAAFLAGQVREDGSFIYGIHPRTDREIGSYNILRHAGSVWSMICQYRASKDPALEEPVRRAIDYMLDQVVYRDENTAYLYEEKSDEIKLGGCGICVLALTEYVDVFGGEDYRAVCESLGNGIISLLNEDTGEYYHVLNSDFTPKEEYRTVFYDGEATFALCRLYGLTGDARWLAAAQKAVEHFIAEDYTQYVDHWVAYSMNEITKYVDDPAYYEFGLRNAQVNLKKIAKANTTSHINLELLMATFELYVRAQERGISTDSLDLRSFLDTITIRVNRQLDGYFYPEYAMYMANPGRILHSFMVRHEDYRVRIDDVQHNIGGYYLFSRNYDQLVSYGLLEGGNTDNK